MHNHVLHVAPVSGLLCVASETLNEAGCGRQDNRANGYISDCQAQEAAADRAHPDSPAARTARWRPMADCERDWRTETDSGSHLPFPTDVRNWMPAALCSAKLFESLIALILRTSAVDVRRAVALARAAVLTLLSLLWFRCAWLISNPARRYGRVRPEFFGRSDGAKWPVLQ